MSFHLLRSAQWHLLGCHFCLILSFFVNDRPTRDRNCLDKSNYWLSQGRLRYGRGALKVKNACFSKVSRLKLKNFACPALLNFEIQRGVAVSIFNPQSCKFEKMSIFCRFPNDFSIIFWSFWPKICNLLRNNFLVHTIPK